MRAARYITCRARAPAADLELMRQIDRLHLEFPFAGARMLRRLLAANGSKAGRRCGHVRTLMLRMGIEALYRRPGTTKPEPGHKICVSAWNKDPVSGVIGVQTGPH